MAEKEIVKRYSNDDLTVIWKPRKCIHSGICVKLLPEVYDPKSRPWIQPQNASGSRLQRQIDKCPSGALSYELKSPEKEIKDDTNMSTKVEILKKGPLLLHGNVEVVHTDGSSELKKRTTAFCRCGASGNKPYCDGTHNDNDFDG